MGLATARGFAESGARVVITGRREALLIDACKELGAGVSYYISDVTQRDDASELVTATERDVGPIHCLVNNAGVNLKKPFLEMSDSEVDAIIQTNLLGVYALSRACAQTMKQRKGGVILMISSMAALVGLTGVTAYSATKAALNGLTRTMATELGEHGIRVNSICPGFIDTPMFRKAMEGDLERKERLLARTPLGRVGTPEDIANAAVFLASDEARFITGASIPVDGGFSVGF